MKLPVISLFTGAMGLDLGLEQVGFETRVAVECDKYAAETIRANRPNIHVLEAKIETLTTEQILDAAGLKVGEAFLVVGGPSCQAFSTVGKRGSFTDDRGTLFRHFLRIVEEAKPKFFIMENVKGIISAAIKHRPLNERGPGHPPLTSEELLGSAFTIVAREISALGGYTAFDLLNSADYGVPQKRDRIVFIGSLDGLKIEIPKPTHAKIATDELKAWVNLRDALEGLEETKQQYVNLPANTSKYITQIAAGSNWRSLAPELQKDAIGEGAYRSWGGRTGFLRRLAWDAPSPALTTSPINKATLFAHPEKNRPLSIQEYARIQGFPDSWVFKGPVSAIYKQIGNAVPIGLGKVIGETVLKAHTDQVVAEKLGTVICNNISLMKRLSNRNLTQLNPPEMSGITCPDKISEWNAKSKEWLNSRELPKLDLFKYLTSDLVPKTSGGSSPLELT